MNQKEMNQVIKEAIEVSLSLHKNVDSYKLPSDVKIKYIALGQCLRSLVDLLENDARRDQTATA